MEKNPVNVLFINHSVRDGGPGRSLFYILKYIDRNNINPYVLIPKDDIFSESLKNEGIYENIIIETSFPENIFRPRLGMDLYSHKSDNLDFVTKIKKVFSAIINIFELAAFILRSGRLLEPNKINIIYCNGTVAKIAGAFMGKLNSTPVIWHVRNIQQTYILKTIIKSLARCRTVKKIICVSSAAAAQFKDVSEKVEVVYNGIDPGDYKPSKARGVLRQEFKIKPGTVIVGSTGRLVPRKGYENLIKAAGMVKEKLTHKNFLFVVIGDTPHFFQYDHLDYLKRKVMELGLKDNFLFTGYRDDVKPYLKNFDIFVIPSAYPDPFPRSVIEAMCFSLPVIGYEIGGIAEAVETGSTGYLSKTGDIEDFASNIQKLINKKDKREQMGKAARQRVIELCNAEDRSKDIQKIIMSLK